MNITPVWAIFIGSIGNLVEWYDFYAYTAFALYFAPAFFPQSDPVVQQWTEVSGAMEAWAKIGPTYDAVIRSGRELDRIARLRAECGLPMDELDMKLLHQGYWAAFRASKIKGIVEKADEMGQVGARRTDEIFPSVSLRVNP